MDKILVMDEHNYDENMDEIYRVAVRGIIFIDGKLLLIQSSFDELKLPGGGIETGEDDIQALIREVKEETGYEVIPETIRPFGCTYVKCTWNRGHVSIQKMKRNTDFIKCVTPWRMQ